MESSRYQVLGEIQINTCNIPKIAPIFLLTLAFIILWPAMSRAENANPPKVYFSEIMGAGSSLSTRDKWIEFYNDSDNPLDFSDGGYEYCIFNETSGKVIATFNSGIIKSHGYFIVAARRDEGSILDKLIGSVDNNSIYIVDKGFSWDKSKFKLSFHRILRDENKTIIEDKQIDIAGEGKKLYYSETDGQIASMQRVDFAKSGGDKASWATSTQRKNLDDGVLDYATPGARGRVFDSIALKRNKFPLGGKINLNFDYAILDSTYDPAEEESTRIEVSLIVNDNVVETLRAIPREKQFVFSPQPKCPEVKIDFLDSDSTYSRYSKTFPLICYQLSRNIKISEFLSHPTNSEGKSESSSEWIELINQSGEPINLSGWQLIDFSKKESGKPGYQFSEKDVWKLGQDSKYYLLLSKISPIGLNDTGDSIYLIDPEGAVIDKVEYSDSSGKHANQAYARQNDAWFWTTAPTPGMLNVIVVPAVDSPVESSAPKAPARNSTAIESIQASPPVQQNIVEPDTLTVVVLTTTKKIVRINLADSTTLTPVVLGATYKREPRYFKFEEYLLYFVGLFILTSMVSFYGISRQL